MSDLKDVVNELKKQNKLLSESKTDKSSTQVEKGLTDVSSSIKDMKDAILKKLDNQQLDNLEDKLEKKRATKKQSRIAQQGEKMGQRAFNFSVGPAIAGIPMSLAGLIGGLGAVSGALVGLRGWELTALKNIDLVGKGLKGVMPQGVLKAIDQKFINVRARVLKAFGLSAALATGGDVGRGVGGLRTELKTSVFDQIMGRVRSLKSSVLRVFGLTVDGLPIISQGDDGLFKKNIIGRVTFQINRLLKPLVNVSEGVAKFAMGIGKPIFDFARNFLGGAGGVALKVFQKILWPIGIVMSAFKGMKEFTEKKQEGATYYEAAAAGIGMFVGDFVGAPLNLLKDMLGWVIGKFGFTETAKEIKEFDIVSKIANLTSGILLFPSRAIDWITGEFADDPTAALQSLWGDIFAPGFKSLADIMFWPVNTFMDWISKKLGWRSEDAPKFNLVDEITSRIVAIKDFFMDFIPSIEGIKKKLGMLVDVENPADDEVNYLLDRKNAIALPRNTSDEEMAKLAKATKGNLVKQLYGTNTQSEFEGIPSMPTMKDTDRWNPFFSQEDQLKDLTEQWLDRIMAPPVVAPITNSAVDARTVNNNNSTSNFVVRDQTQHETFKWVGGAR